MCLKRGTASQARFNPDGKRKLPGGRGGWKFIPPEEYKEFLSLGHGGASPLEPLSTHHTIVSCLSSPTSPAAADFKHEAAFGCGQFTCLHSASSSAACV